MFNYQEISKYSKEAIIELPLSRIQAYRHIKTLLFEGWKVKEVIEKRVPELLKVKIHDKRENLTYEVTFRLKETNKGTQVHIIVKAPNLILFIRSPSMIFAIIAPVITYFLFLEVSLFLNRDLFETAFLTLPFLFMLVLVAVYLEEILLIYNLVSCIRFISNFMRELRASLPNSRIGYILI